MGWRIGAAVMVVAFLNVVIFFGSYLYQGFDDDSGSQAYVVSAEKPLHLLTVGEYQYNPIWEVRVENGVLQVYSKYRVNVCGTQQARWTLFVYPAYPNTCAIGEDCSFQIQTAGRNRFMVERMNSEYKLWIPDHWIVRAEQDPEFFAY